MQQLQMSRKDTSTIQEEERENQTHSFVSIEEDIDQTSQEMTRRAAKPKQSPIKRQPSKIRVRPMGSSRNGSDGTSQDGSNKNYMTRGSRYNPTPIKNIELIQSP